MTLNHPWYLTKTQNSGNLSSCFEHILVPQFGYSQKKMPFTLENIENNRCHFIILSTEKGINPYPFKMDFIHNLVDSYSKKCSKSVKSFGNIHVIDTALTCENEK